MFPNYVEDHEAPINDGYITQSRLAIQHNLTDIREVAELHRKLLQETRIGSNIS